VIAALASEPKRDLPRSGRGLLLLCALLVGCDGNATKFIGAHRTADGVAGASGRDEPRVDGAAGAHGCGWQAEPGQHAVSITSSGQQREFYLSVPDPYDPELAYPIVFGLHARGESGQQVRDYLALEQVQPNDWALFVYPDAILREFPDDATVGWQNGPTGGNYGGEEDLVFMSDIVRYLEQEYCVDPSALLATGRGWGGEFASVMGCYLENVRAVVSVAANIPYYLPTEPDDSPACVGQRGIWVMQGKGDVQFPLEYGYQQRDFWMRLNDCELEAPTPLVFDGFADDDACEAYQCGREPTRFCSYTAEAGHGIPGAYYAEATVEFLRSFL
jgi:poly(3-hydroxybutyrate) depolymerase